MPIGGGRFVDIPADRLRAELDDIGARCKMHGRGRARWHRKGSERVFDVDFGSWILRVYTSISVHGDHVRGCGKDAIRITVGKRRGDSHHWGKSRTIYRTAPQGAPDRPGVFLNRLRDTMRAVYAENR
jgi:hypothetical protein